MPFTAAEGETAEMTCCWPKPLIFGRKIAVKIDG
jgi:hypothetical protein